MRRVLGLIVCLTFQSVILAGRTTNYDLHYDEESPSPGRSFRDPRFFGALVSFSQTPCANGGVCFSRKKCTVQKGEVMDSCAQGVGVCCKFKDQCTAPVQTRTVTKVVTNLIQPTVSSTCTFLFPRQKGICQLRVKFNTFSIGKPNANGNCQTDSMSISGTTTVAGLTICGTVRSNDEIYLDYGTGDEIRMIMQTTTQNSNNPMYDLTVTQIPCDSNERAPANCLQWLRTATGNFQSFNYPQQQLNNQRYRVCVRRPDDTSRLQWNRFPRTGASGTDWTSFCITGNCRTMGVAGIQPPMPTLGARCTTDFVNFPDFGRYCNNQDENNQPMFPLGGLVVGTFEMWVNFDGNEPSRALAPITSPGTMQTDCSSLLTVDGYLPWTWDTGVCTAKPATGDPDVSNSGFSLDYSVVPSGTPLGKLPPPL